MLDPMITIDQKRLLDVLARIQPTPAAKALLKRTGQRFVLDYGWLYEPVPLPKHIVPGIAEQCFRNAVELTIDDRSLIYCEGFALLKECSLPILHAWVTDGQGAAIDNTWPEPAVAYAGVPFKSLFVTATVVKNHATISLIDDWQNNYPLRSDMGDRPELWLEPRGRGIAYCICERADP